MGGNHERVCGGRLACARPGVCRQGRNEEKEEKMASIAQEAHLPALDHRRGEVGRELQGAEHPVE
jgi:hypothetical protein